MSILEDIEHWGYVQVELRDNITLLLGIKITPEKTIPELINIVKNVLVYGYTVEEDGTFAIGELD